MDLEVLFHDTKFPKESLTRYFSTDALGAVVFVGGQYEIEFEDMVDEIRLRRTTEFEFDDVTD